MNNSKAPINLLPIDGELHYFPNFINQPEASNFFYHLLSCSFWQHDIVKMFGKVIQTKRKTAWMADEQITYTYAGKTKYPIAWETQVYNIKQLVENHTSLYFNACLLNLYANGNEGMAYHADNEPEIIPQSMIVSISLGAERKFVCKHRHLPHIVDLKLAPGSMLIMSGNMQNYWLHALPVAKRIVTPRINLTFRQMLS